MGEYKPNSHNFREQLEAEPEKKVEKVIAESATIRKKSALQNITDIFISEDVANVKNYILMDVLIPAVKKAISDIVTNGIDMILYGDTGQRKKSQPMSSKISYGSYYMRENEQKETNVVLRGLNYDDILFSTRADAEAVLDAMNDIIGKYRMVSVSDLYDLASIDNNNYTLDKYGWYDIGGCKVVRVRDGYVLRLPKPIPLC